MLRRSLGAIVDAAWLRRQFTLDADAVHDVSHGARMLAKAPGFTAVALFVLAWQTPLRRPLAALVPAGKMTLTLYVGQSLVAAWLLYGYGLRLYDDLSSAGMVLGGVVAFALQLALAALWFRHFRYGPLEWLWRAATRTTLSVPFRN